MNRAVFLALAAAAVLAGCGKSSSQDQAKAPAPQAAPSKPALSAGLPKRPEFPAFYIDRIGNSSDPLTTKVQVASGGPLEVSGFAYDGVTKTPAKGVDVVVDGRAFPATYGSPRADVATNLKNPALGATGYVVTLPADVFTPGAHKILVRVVTADGASFYESPAFAFTAQ